MKTLLFYLITFTALDLITHPLLAQNPDIEWQKSFGGSWYDDGYYIQQTSDNGYIIAGNTQSNDSDVIGNHGGNDVWILKLDNVGNIKWKKCYGGSGDDLVSGIKQTPDKGFVFTASTLSNNGNVLGNHGGKDIWLVKIDSLGLIKWKKCYGGNDDDVPNSICLTPDKGYIIAGYTYSNDGDVSGNHGGSDGWVLKLDSVGTLQWKKCLGGSAADIAYSIDKTIDGGYIISATTESKNGDVTCNFDGWIFKLDNAGNIQWQNCLDEIVFYLPSTIKQTFDGGYIIACSVNGNISGGHGGANDYWIVKLDVSGTLKWQKCIGGNDYDEAFSIQQTVDSGFITVGFTKSNNGDINGRNKNPALNVLLAKLSLSGDLLWTEVLGGSDPPGEEGWDIIQTSDGGYAMIGSNFSSDGDCSHNNGEYDYWVVKLSASTKVPSVISSNTYLVYPNPAASDFTFKNTGTQLGHIKLFDVLGKQCLDKTFAPNQQLSANVSYLPKGVYFLKVVENSGGTLTKKVVIQ